jgi:hypothetical protein
MKEAKDEKMQQPQFLMILSELAKREVELLAPFITEFMNPGLWQPYSAHSVITILQMYALQSEVRRTIMDLEELKQVTLLLSSTIVKGFPLI